MDGPGLFAAAIVMQRLIRVFSTTPRLEVKELLFQPEVSARGQPELTLAHRNTPTAQHFFPVCGPDHPLATALANPWKSNTPLARNSTRCWN
jgi:hypothetical protein